MGILKILLEEIETTITDKTEQVQSICDQIMDQEKDSMEYPELMPKGSQVFLSLEAPGRNIKEVGFLTLEREDIEKYIAVYYTLELYRINKDNIEETINPRRRKVWEINEFKPQKILTQFALKLKFLRGE